MASKGKRVSEARPAVEIAESVKLVRQLIALADQQIRKASNDLGIARVGLAELEAELATRGSAPSKGVAS
jgi:hypothetical protein